MNGEVWVATYIRNEMRLKYFVYAYHQDLYLNYKSMTVLARSFGEAEFIAQQRFPEQFGEDKFVIDKISIRPLDISESLEKMKQK